jgi:hypothetical protein
VKLGPVTRAWRCPRSSKKPHAMQATQTSSANRPTVRRAAESRAPIEPVPTCVQADLTTHPTT